MSTTNPRPRASKAEEDAFWESLEDVREAAGMIVPHRQRKRELDAMFDRDEAVRQEWKALTTGNLKDILKLARSAVDALARPQVRFAEVNVGGERQTVRITETRLPDVSRLLGEQLELIGELAKLKALQRAPLRKSGSIEGPEGTERLTLTVPAADSNPVKRA